MLTNLQAESGELPDEAAVKALQLRNQSEEWIYSDKRYLTSYTLHKRKKYPFGIVQIEMELDKDLIRSIVISGDFFGEKPIEELERALVGQRPASLTPFDVSPYIAQMTFLEFAELLGQ